MGTRSERKSLRQLGVSRASKAHPARLVNDQDRAHREFGPRQLRREFVDLDRVSEWLYIPKKLDWGTLRAYLRRLEAAVLSLLSEFGSKAARDSDSWRHWKERSREFLNERVWTQWKELEQEKLQWKEEVRKEAFQLAYELSERIKKLEGK